MRLKDEEIKEKGPWRTSPIPAHWRAISDAGYDRGCWEITKLVKDFYELEQKPFDETWKIDTSKYVTDRWSDHWAINEIILLYLASQNIEGPEETKPRKIEATITGHRLRPPMTLERPEEGG